jgi:hypothetical protein
VTSNIYWRDTYTIFGPIFYELVGYYESSYNRDPERILQYEKVDSSSEVLPIYGITTLQKHIMYLVQLPLVIRLREIRQLSNTHILFPGATHTRYEHSLGVMQKSCSILSKLSATVLKDCEPKGFKITNDEQVVLGIAALLHDLGHPAWGHALDGITGFVVQLLGRTMETLFAPKKLDSAITLYLLLQNDQMKKALDVCSQEINDASIKSNLGKIVAQIIMEEKKPLFEEMTKDPLIVQKIHLLTTILGTYHKVGGINCDRIDWIARDAHHANLGSKLEEEDVKKYFSFIDKVKSDNFSVNVKDCAFCFVNDQIFMDDMDYLREKIYEKIYEGLERSFSDSLLIRLFHSATSVLDNAGNSFASPSITARAIMGYLLMPDNRVKDYTGQILLRAKENQQLLDSAPAAGFISKSYELLKLFDESVVYIMHYLSSKAPEEMHSEKLGLDFGIVRLDQINQTMIVVTSKVLSNLIEHAVKASKSDITVSIAIVFQDLLLASRTNPIAALKIQTLEALLDKQYPADNVGVLVNYYFFRRLEDCFKRKVTDLDSLKQVLEIELKSTPIFFILTSTGNSAKIKQIFELLSDNLVLNFAQYFQAIEQS